MKEINFFDTNQRSPAERKNIIKNEKLKKPTNDYMNFGYDYFDNDKIGVGYGGYEYDGRYKRSAEKIIQFYKLKKNSQILEIGCAKGFIVYELYKLGMDVYGLELSQYAIENSVPEIKKKINLYNVENGIPFKDSYFDLVISKEVFPHLNPKKIDFVINECNRVSKGNIFLEIQCIETEEEHENFKKWDRTHQIIKTKKQWTSLFKKNNYIGDIHFKYLT